MTYNVSGGTLNLTELQLHCTGFLSGDKLTTKPHAWCTSLCLVWHDRLSPTAAVAFPDQQPTGHVHVNTFGDSFAASGLRVWNNLPSHSQQDISHGQFTTEKHFCLVLTHHIASWLLSCTWEIFLLTYLHCTYLGARTMGIAPVDFRVHRKYSVASTRVPALNTSCNYCRKIKQHVKSTLCSQTALNALAPGLHSGPHWVALQRSTGLTLTSPAFCFVADRKPFIRRRLEIFSRELYAG